MPTARELLERSFDCAIRQDGVAFAALFATDGKLALPFEELQFVGPVAIGDHARRAWQASPIVAARFELGEVIDSETGLTAEYVVHGTVRATGEACVVAGICLLEVSDDQIGTLREYLEPRAVRDALENATPRATRRSSRAFAA